MRGDLMRTPGFRGARWQQCSIKYIGIAASAVATVLGIGLAVFKPLSLNSALVQRGELSGSAREIVAKARERPVFHKAAWP